jgi:uncharacterized protein (TIGR03437 family)
MVKLVLLLMPAVALAYETGPYPRYTAAPGDDRLACASAGCHTGNLSGGPINAASGGVTVTFSSMGSYTPGGAAITITVSVSDPVNTHFGFQMSARLDSDQTNGQAGDFSPGPNQLVICDDNSIHATPQGKVFTCPKGSEVQFIEHDFTAGSQVSATPYTFTWTPPATNVGPVHFYVAGNAVNGNLRADAGDHVYTASYVLPPAGSSGPVLTSGSVANGATYKAGGLVPGSWAQVKGTGLSGVTRIWGSDDFKGLGNNLPTNLSGVQVMVNNLRAAVYYIDSGQVSFQVPSGVSGTASVQVINNGAASDTVTGAAVSSSPGIFPIIVNGANYPAAVFASDSMFAGDPSAGSVFRKAKAGEAVQLYATGLVTTTAGVVPGPPQGIDGVTVTVTVGSATVNADFAGLVAVGEFQINFKVPNLPAGSYPISIAVGGVSSPATIDSNPPGPIMLPIGP